MTTPLPLTQMVHHPENDESADENQIKTRIIQLDRSNWVQWSCQMKNYLKGCGYQELLHPPSDAVKITSKYKCKNSAALAMLWTAVCDDVQGVLLENQDSFFNAWEALGDACGRNAIITTCEALFQLISLQYEPGQSLESHTNLFLRLYAAYKSITYNTDFRMDLPPSMAAAFFLRSLNKDKELTGLIQTLYDSKPFDIITVTKHVSLEHTRRQNHSEEVLFNKPSTSKEDDKKVPKAHDNQSRGKRRNKKKKADPKPTGNDRNPSLSQRMERLEKLILANHSTTPKGSQPAHAVSSPEETMDPQDNSESDMYYLPIEGFITDHRDRSQKIYLDSGCGQLVVNNLNVQITHHGTLNFFGFDIFPVSYAPLGPVNLISVSQLIDHGLKPIYKNDVFLIKRGNSIVATFQRDGNLYSTRSLINAAWYSSPRTIKDWHSLFGHPSDEYLRHFLKQNNVNQSFISSKNCEVCRLSKLERHPHNRSLPTTPSPFYKLHTDILEINVPSKKGYRYILALVDDFSRFNRIVLLKFKDQASSEIISFIKEIRNKLNKVPAFLHSDRGAEQFNRSLLSKIRCLLNQSNIPVNYWDQAAEHASLLLNNTPHCFLNMITPANCLINHNSSIEPRLDFSQLISFGAKVNVKNKFPDSKITGGSSPLCALTFEQYSDSMKFLNIDNGRIKISRDYVPSISDKPLKVRKPTQSLPSETVQLTLHKPISSNVTSSMDQVEVLDSISVNAPHPVDNEVQPKAPDLKKTWKYVPYYEKACKDVSSFIIEGSRRKKNDETFLTDVIPYSQAVNDPLEQQEWFSAMQKEFDSLMQHNTGELVPRPRNSKVIGGMWRLTKKKNEYGEVYRHKARWVVLGNHQEHLIHYFDTWSSIGRNETFKILISLLVNKNMKAYQFDVETAFLHGEMDADVYVIQVKGFEVQGKENWVWRLNKSLYGTKQAPRMWKEKLTKALNSLEMFSAISDEALFVNKAKTMFLHIHVDDGFLVGENKAEIIAFISKLMSLTQHDFCLKILATFNMNDSRGVKTPCNGNLSDMIEEEAPEFDKHSFQQAIGFLNYLAQHTRPDILFTINQLARCSTNPTIIQWKAVKHLLRYIKNTSMLGIMYTRCEENVSTLQGWADADYANSKKDRKSISGTIVTVFGNPVSWMSKKQSIVAQSTTEAEFVSMNVCSKQMRWIANLLSMDIGVKMNQPILYNDNSGAVTISKQANLNPNTKHIEVRYQYLRYLVTKKLLIITQVSTNEMMADILTKPTTINKLKEFKTSIHLTEQEGVLK
ncbi:hypothetical protein O181_041352 [Austropuccinia psidii MF-1]|uniref:Integrase catalytic domain-containing protein n=1 Tax=Austropuccinia psidii MF-1 TaxID=1389203 RepID=A0A9Q3DGJ1_9BASI|nr:hypothetical protein [Austropuccinia psidii MF-1]